MKTIKLSTPQILTIGVFSSLFGFWLGHMFFALNLSKFIFYALAIVAVLLGALYFQHLDRRRGIELSISPMQTAFTLIMSVIVGLFLGYLYLTYDFSELASYLSIDTTQHE